MNFSTNGCPCSLPSKPDLVSIYNKELYQWAGKYCLNRRDLEENLPKSYSRSRDLSKMAIMDDQGQSRTIATEKLWWSFVDV